MVQFSFTLELKQFIGTVKRLYEKNFKKEIKSVKRIYPKKPQTTVI